MSTPLTIRQKLTLALGVPFVLLLVLEGVARMALFFHGEASASAPAPNLVEMPTWMQRETNARVRTAIRPVDAATLEWLRIFEEGDGFRVRLIPNQTFHVLNTFSRVAADETTRYEVRANSLGFRSAEPKTPKPATTLRISIFGDSSSFGWGVEEEHTFSTLLKQKLAPRLPARWEDIEVLNFAIPGDSSEYGRLIAERYLKKYPSDIVILGFGANDAKHVAVPHRAEVNAFRETRELQGLRKSLNYSALVRAIRALLATKDVADESAPPVVKSAAVPKKHYRENLRMMAEESKSHGALQTVILTLCTPADYRKAARKMAHSRGYIFVDGQAELLRAIPKISERAGDLLPLVNASAAELRANPLFYVSSDGCHPNALGHHLVAGRLADALIESGSLT